MAASPMAARVSSAAAAVAIFWTLMTVSSGDTSTEVVEDDPGDNRMGAHYEFRYTVPPGSQECFFQDLRQGAQFHVAFEVLRGADRNVDVVIKRPDGSIMDSHLWTNEGTTDREVEIPGPYALCIDNSFSRFSPKLVYIYLAWFVPEEWERFASDVEEFGVSVENFTSTLGRIDKDVGEMLKMQAINRRHSITDWYIVRNNMTGINRWSGIMIGVIIVTSCVQVYFVRRLFQVKNVTSKSSKPRA